MRVLLQRVRSGSVSIDEQQVAAISTGLVLLVGVGPQDGPEQAVWLAKKIAGLRVFEDEDGKSNLSVRDVGGEALVVSQFTLYANVEKGRRPSFTGAAPPDLAEPLIESFAEHLRQAGVPTKTGEFGQHMLVSIENDGPVTIMLER